jgi:hypothetical protein
MAIFPHSQFWRTPYLIGAFSSICQNGGNAEADRAERALSGVERRRDARYGDYGRDADGSGAMSWFMR